MDKKYVIYSRKSKFTGKGESVENQVEMCRNYIAMHFGDEAAEQVLVYEDEGFSGGNLERPQFKKMMKDSHKTDFAAIVVYRLDRISRNISDFAGLIQDLGDRGIGFISIKEQFDTGSPMGRAMMYIASVFSQLERETIAERIRDNMHELAKTGRWLGGNTPTGYTSESVTKVTVDGKTKSAYKLVQIPEEISLVELIYEKFLETGSLTKTDQFLLEGHYRTKQGKAFTRFAIRAILTNPVYMIADQNAYGYLKAAQVELFSPQEEFDGTRGIMVYNRTMQRPGKASVVNPMEEWIVALGAHQGVVSGQKWIQVQDMLEMNRCKSFRRGRSNEALLSGLLYCGDCGNVMRPKLTERVDAQGKRIYTYRCTIKERTQGHLCSIKNVSGNLLDAKVLEHIVELGKEPSRFLQELEKGKRALLASREDYDAEIAKLKEQLAEHERDIGSLVTTLPRYLNTDMESYITGQITELHGKSEGLKKRIGDLETMLDKSTLQDQQFEILRDLIRQVGSQVETMSVEQKRNALRMVIRKVVWDGENAHIFFLTDEETENSSIVIHGDKISSGEELGDLAGPQCECSE